MNDPKEKLPQPEQTDETQPAAPPSAVSPELSSIQSNVSKAERLALLREAKEVVEEDSDLNDIFMLVRSDLPVTKHSFLKAFPQAKALAITQEQLWQIEADGNFFSYMTTSGKRKYFSADDMTEDSIVLFLEELG